MENLDSRLLRNQAEEQNAARELKERKKGDTGEAGGDEAGATGEPRSLRQRVQAARQVLNIKEQAKKKLEEKVFAPVRTATTNRALQWAWGALIPSWGLSSIWINIHVFLKSVFGEKLFCKLGEEWIPKQATEAVDEAGKTVGKAIGLVEVMVLIFIDIIIFFIIVGFVAMFTDKGTFETMTGEANKNQSAPAVQPAK